MMQIARNLREVWNQKEYSISQLADKSGVTANNIYKMEKDFKNISVKTLLKLCKRLEVKVTDIILKDNSNQEVSDAEVFAYLTESLTATEKNAILEVVRICKGFVKDLNRIEMLKGRENRKIVAIYEVTETYKKC